MRIMSLNKEQISIITLWERFVINTKYQYVIDRGICQCPPPPTTTELKDEKICQKVTTNFQKKFLVKKFVGEKI